MGFASESPIRDRALPLFTGKEKRAQALDLEHGPVAGTSYSCLLEDVDLSKGHAATSFLAKAWNIKGTFLLASSTSRKRGSPPYLGE